MKDFTAIKYLLDVIEEEANRMEEQKKWYIQYLEEEETRKNNLFEDEDGNRHTKNGNGEVEDLSSWDVDRLDRNIKEYAARIRAYDTVLNLLSGIDLNKVKL